MTDVPSMRTTDAITTVVQEEEIWILIERFRTKNQKIESRTHEKEDNHVIYERPKQVFEIEAEYWPEARRNNLRVTLVLMKV